jgi:hypothetical protein
LATNRVLAVADGGRPLAGEGGHEPMRRSGDPFCPIAVVDRAVESLEIVAASVRERNSGFPEIALSLLPRSDNQLDGVASQKCCK